METTNYQLQANGTPVAMLTTSAAIKSVSCLEIARELSLVHPTPESMKLGLLDLRLPFDTQLKGTAKHLFSVSANDSAGSENTVVIDWPTPGIGHANFDSVRKAALI